MRSYRQGYYQKNEEHPRLSTRQIEVLQLLSEGKSAKEAAGILNISSRTIEFHKYRIMEDFDIKSSAELIRFAIKNEIVSL